VGSGRSGTTLVRHILNAAENVAICGETRFLRIGNHRKEGYRNRFARLGDMSTTTGTRRVVDYIYGESHGGNWWRWLQRNVPRERFLAELLASERSDRALFDLVMTLSAGDRPIHGEKTPAHLYEVPTLLEWFPDARVVHVVRDPRAVFVSKRKKMAEGQWEAGLRVSFLRKEPFLSLTLLVLVSSSWRRAIRLHQRYARNYPATYHLVRFEDLVTEPEAVGRRLCDCLGLEFSEEMVRHRVYDSSFGTSPPGPEGLDATAANRWRQHLHPVLDRYFVLSCGHQLRAMGYQA
jgi:hypothetical protein